MFRITLLQSRFLAFFLMMLLQWAAVSPVMAQHTYPATSSGNSIRQITKVEKTLTEAVRSGLEAYDDTPLGDRIPLVLIHGIGASASTQYNWERFLDYAEKEKPFMGRYKIYLYHYDSSRSVPDISLNLRQTLHGFIGGLGGRKIKILAYSEGGLLTRNAMQDDYVDQHTEEVITVATPFHGSPLANPEWLRQQIRTESPFSLVRIGQRLAYNITGRLYPSFKEDFHWDNFDGAIPAEQYSRHYPNVVKTDYALARKEKFITYGSYFGMEVNPDALPEVLGVETELPKERRIFANLFRRNVLFSLIRHNIGKLPLAIRNGAKRVIAKGQAEDVGEQAAEAIKKATDEPDSTVKTGSVLLALADTAPGVLKQAYPTVVREVEKNTGPKEELSKANALMATGDLRIVKEKPDIPQSVSMMVFNDGISPISSTLWLGRYMPNSDGSALSVDKLWDTLKELKGNDNTRLFAGIDHRNWMDGTTRTGQSEVHDLLNPDEPSRGIFAWMIHDLMN